MGGGEYVKGWVPLNAKSEWVPPARHPAPFEAVATRDDWVGVEWPPYHGDQDGEGMHAYVRACTRRSGQ